MDGANFDGYVLSDELYLIFNVPRQLDIRGNVGHFDLIRSRISVVGSHKLVT